jgi:membrane protein implicated in regulation of membrane protease activity
MRSFWRDNGLTITLMLMFLGSVAGMALTGRASHNEELAKHGQAGLGLAAYLASGEFLSALFENWESEFLQMSSYVVLTAILFQRGSAESRDPDDPDRPNDEAQWRARHPVGGWLYEHSLGLALAALFVASFLLHWWFSMVAANKEALRHGGEMKGFLAYLADPQFWFESFQNWQSEFLSTAVLVVLSIMLRHKGSPESKPVGAADSDTGA